MPEEDSDFNNKAVFSAEMVPCDDEDVLSPINDIQTQEFGPTDWDFR
jgi:hypothetical protein